MSLQIDSDYASLKLMAMIPNGRAFSADDMAAALSAAAGLSSGGRPPWPGASLERDGDTLGIFVSGQLLLVAVLNNRVEVAAENAEILGYFLSPEDPLRAEHCAARWEITGVDDDEMTYLNLLLAVQEELENRESLVVVDLLADPEDSDDDGLDDED